MQDVRVAFFLAFRSIARSPKSTIVMLIFILLLSFLNLMFISGILAGLTDAIIRQNIETTSSYLDIDPQQQPIQKAFIPDQRDLRQRIETIPGVIATARHYTLGGGIAYDRDKNGKSVIVSAPFIGIDPEEEQRVTTVSQYMVDGNYLDPTHPDQIVLGADVAGGYGLTNLDNLGGVKAGEKVVVTYDNGVSRTYTVKGVYKVGFFSGYAYILSKEAESVLGVANYASRILVNVDPAEAPLENYAQSVRQIDPSLRVSTYRELLGQIDQISFAFSAISFIVSAVSVLVAAITIFVLIYVNAVTKRRQIGILKAIGIKQGVIIMSYVFQSLFFTSAGVLLGSGVIFLILSPLLRQHPVQLPLGNVVLTFTTTGVTLSILSVLLAGLIAGVIPSWRVARQNIITAIWGG